MGETDKLLKDEELIETVFEAQGQRPIALLELWCVLLLAQSDERIERHGAASRDVDRDERNQ